MRVQRSSQPRISEKPIEKELVDAAEAFDTDETGKTVMKASTLSRTGLPGQPEPQ